jgi:hypothetical protein
MLAIWPTVGLTLFTHASLHSPIFGRTVGQATLCNAARRADEGGYLEKESLF